MAISRYRKNEVLLEKFLYKIDKKTKKKKNIVFYNSTKYKNLTDKALAELETIEIAFLPTDTLMGLSQKYYNNPAYWWIIALINNVGSERDLTAGQSLVILKPLETLLTELEL